MTAISTPGGKHGPRECQQHPGTGLQPRIRSICSGEGPHAALSHSACESCCDSHSAVNCAWRVAFRSGSWSSILMKERTGSDRKPRMAAVSKIPSHILKLFNSQVVRAVSLLHFAMSFEVRNHWQSRHFDRDLGIEACTPHVAVQVRKLLCPFHETLYGQTKPFHNTIHSQAKANQSLCRPV
jgi:hypothetical protein